jgi:hypothetical protein
VIVRKDDEVEKGDGEGGAGSACGVSGDNHVFPETACFIFGF